MDILIVGSGPAGLSAAVYAKRAGLSVQVAEKIYLGTGQIAESCQVDNYLGMPGTSGYDLGEAFRNHAKDLGVEFYDGEVVAFSRTQQGWLSRFDNGETLESKAVIYAAGASPRHLQVKGEEALLGRGISFCAVCDGAFFRDKAVAVVGGGDTALDDARYLSEICSQVYLIHRREQFRGSVKTLEQLRKKENVELVTSANIVEIQGDTQVEAVVLDTGRTLAVSGVFEAVGMVPQTGVFQTADASQAEMPKLDDAGYIVAEESGITSAAGFFAAGDVRTKQLRQVVTAVSDGANAATSAAEYILSLN